MRLSALGLVSILAGACAATIPVPHKPIPPPYVEIEQNKHFEPKPLPPRPGRIDPEVKTRLDSVEEELRNLRESVTAPKVSAGTKSAEP